MVEPGWLDEFLDAMDSALGNIDVRALQPTSWRHLHPLIANEWLGRIERLIDERARQNIPYEKLASAISPVVARCHLYFCIEELKLVHGSREKRLKFADFFYQILRTHLREDLFGLTGTNRVHPPQQIARIMVKPFQPGSLDSARALGRLYNAAYNYGAGLYLDFYLDFCVENFGPYDLGGGKSLVIKTLRHLRPNELWQSSVPFGELTWFAVYQDVGFKTSLVTAWSQYDGDPIAGLTAWRLEVDGQAVEDLEKIKHMTRELGGLSIRQWTELKNLDEASLIGKAIWIQCFVFKKASDLLGLDWKPDASLLNAVKGKTLMQGYAAWDIPESEGDRKAYWRKIWDPRVDFYPEGKRA